MKPPHLPEVVQSVHDFRDRHPTLNRWAETPLGKKVRKAGFSVFEKGYRWAGRSPAEGRVEWKDHRELALEAIHRGAIQQTFEFAELLRLTEILRPRTVLEIGTGQGGTVFGIAHVAAEDALLVSVDWRDNPFAETYSQQKARSIKKCAGPDQTIELLLGDSHAPSTQQAVSHLLEGRTVDLLFIDGDHSLEGVTQDWLDYAPLVRKGGLVAFHDVVDYGLPDIDVPQLWQRLRPTHDGREIITPKIGLQERPWGGIGLIEIRRAAASNRGRDVNGVANSLTAPESHDVYPPRPPVVQ